MQKTLFRRGASLLLTLALTLSAGLPAFAAEADGLCQHHPSHTEDCGYEATGECTHQCTEDSGCITVSCSHEHVATCYNGAGKLNCHHKCDKTPECNIPITNCIHREHGDCGHSDGKDCNFAVNGCPLCQAVELKGTDVVLKDGTEYTYTGSHIMPAVTVTVDGTVLVENKDYIVTYANNIEVGTGTVIVTATETTGYIGTVQIPFTISKAPETPEFTLVEIKGTDVTIDGTRFSYTGEAIQPAITVTVNGQQLTAGKDYTVAYTNNVEPGTATVTVTGIATASETVGYTGEVSIEFTIVQAQEPSEPTEPSSPSEPSEPSEPTVPSEPTTPSEPTEPSQPSEPTQPSEPADPSEPTVPSEPEADKKPEYKITKGSGSKWRQESGKDLSFDLNADTDDITGISIDGKKLDKTHYAIVDQNTVALKDSYLKKLAIGTYRITVHFEDGTASGTFSVAAANSDIPKTSDTIGLWVGILLTSLAGIGGVALLLRKRIAD